MLEHQEESPRPAQAPSVPNISIPSEIPHLGLEYGFALLRSERVEELDAEARVYQHMQTGAQVRFISNDDTHRRFAIYFKIAATDSCGGFHLADHWLSRGSLQFPAADPINDYLLQSLSSESNAEISDDILAFYAASPDATDFLYQAQLYQASVFAPMLTDQAFCEEGWSIKFHPQTGEPEIGGIFFREMKDNLPNALARHRRTVIENLFPDTHYRFDVDGDPKEIPKLTPGKVRALIREHVHPSNANFFYYGKIDRGEHLRLLSETLSGFERKEIAHVVPVQPRFSKPRRAEAYYPGAKSEDAGRDSIVSVSWVLGTDTALPGRIAMLVLEELLAGASHSPIRRALEESDLGEDLIEEVLDNSLYESFISIGITGTGAAKTDEIEALILSTLASVARDGFEPWFVQFAIDSAEHSLRKGDSEADRGRQAMSKVLAARARGEDPIAAQRWVQELQQLREQVAADPSFFQDIVRELLLENPHRLTTTIRPQRHLIDEWEAEEKVLARELAADWAPVEPEDAPDISARLPKLKIPDLSRHDAAVARNFDDGIWCYPVPKAALTQFSVAISFRCLPLDLVPYAALLNSTLNNLDDGETGAFKGTLESMLKIVTLPNGEVDAYIVYEGESFSNRAVALVHNIRQQFTTLNLDRKREVLRLIVASKAELEQAVVESGVAYAASRASANLEQAECIDEITSGLTYLEALPLVIAETKQRWSGIHTRLEEVRQLLLRCGDVQCQVSGSKQAIRELAPHLRELQATFGPRAKDLPLWDGLLSQQNEGFIIPSQVCSVVRAFNLRAANYQHHGSIFVLMKLLDHAYLWPTIRREIGAYSPVIDYRHGSGILLVGSSADGQPASTLDVAARTSAWLREIAPKVKELRRSKIGAIGERDEPRSAFELAAEDFEDRLRQLPLEFRELERAQIFETMGPHCEALADSLDRAAEVHSPIVVLGSRSELMGLNHQLGEQALKVQALE